MRQHLIRPNPEHGGTHAQGYPKNYHTPRHAPPVALTPTPDPKLTKAAAGEGMMRLFSADWSDTLWESRDPAGKIMRVADGVGDRLAGLSEICWSLTWGDLSKSGRKNADDPMPPGFETHRYQAQALGDLSKALKAVSAAWWDTIKAEDAAQEQRHEPARQRRARA